MNVVEDPPGRSKRKAKVSTSAPCSPAPKVSAVREGQAARAGQLRAVSATPSSRVSLVPAEKAKVPAKESKIASSKPPAKELRIAAAKPFVQKAKGASSVPASPRAESAAKKPSGVEATVAKKGLPPLSGSAGRVISLAESRPIRCLPPHQCLSLLLLEVLQRLLLRRHALGAVVLRRRVGQVLRCLLHGGTRKPLQRRRLT